MPLVPAKCPNCGGNINVDSSLAAAICESCKQPFVVEQAINNFNTTYNITNTNNITADHVTVYENKESEENTVKRIELFVEEKEYQSAMEYLDKLKDLNVGNSEIPRLTGLIISSMEEQINAGIQNWDAENVKSYAEQLVGFDKNNALAASTIAGLPMFKEVSEAVTIVENDINVIKAILAGYSGEVVPRNDIGLYFFNVDFIRLIKSYISIKKFNESLSVKYKEDLESVFTDLNTLLTADTQPRPSQEYLTYTVYKNASMSWVNQMFLIKSFLQDCRELTIDINSGKYLFEETDIAALDKLFGGWRNVNQVVNIDGPSIYGRYVAATYNIHEPIRMLGRCITTSNELIIYIRDYCTPRRLCPSCFEKIGLSGKCKNYSNKYLKQSSCGNCRDQIRVYKIDGSMAEQVYMNFKEFGYRDGIQHMS